MSHAALVRSLMIVVISSLGACAQVAAPMPPNLPPATGLHAENTVQDGLPNYALTAAPSTPSRPERHDEWMPEPVDPMGGYPVSRLFEVLDPTRGCGLALSAEFDPSLHDIDALPAAPVTQLELNTSTARSDCPTP